MHPTHTGASQQEPAGGNGFLGLQEHRFSLILVIKTSRATGASPERLDSGRVGIGLAESGEH